MLLEVPVLLEALAVLVAGNGAIESPKKPEGLVGHMRFLEEPLLTH